MPNAEIVSIGSELLMGQIVDTDAIAMLTEYHINPYSNLC